MGRSAENSDACLGRRLTGRGFVAALALLGAFVFGVAAARAAPPSVTTPWASDVLTTSAQLHGTINPNGVATAYRFEYLTEAAWEANVEKGEEAFAGAARVPKSEAEIGAGGVVLAVVRTALSLSADTAYRYRLRASNLDGTAFSGERFFVTRSAAGGALLPDGRGWEMVSPVDKNGGQIDAPGAILGGGTLQAAGQGGAVTYGSAASFAGGSGAPPASQYVSVRGPSGWSTANVTVPLFAGSFGGAPEGVPYRVFSPDLARGLLLNGSHCRGEGSDCAVANPPLPGTGAPAGYQDYYLRDTGSGSFLSLLGAANVAQTQLQPAGFGVSLAGASPDLTHVVLSSCAALTATASEVPLGEGCDPAKPNLYEWSAATGLVLVNTLPGAALGAQAGAVSADGGRVYWTDLNSGDLFLREGAAVKQVDAAAGGGGTFETASADGSVAFFAAAGHLWRYTTAAGTATDLTPGGGVTGVLGASENGARAYYQDAGGLRLWNGGATVIVAGGAAATLPGDYPPSTGSARVSPDGSLLAFVSSSPLTGYDNTDVLSGDPDSQVFLYDAGGNELTCVSCNPTNARPRGPSSIGGAVPNGEGPGATASYKPRALALAGGRRVFFDSYDALVSTDTNNDADVYQWEAEGTGSCENSNGCLALISSGRAEGGASFLDASADGADAFFLTDGSLVKADPGSFDVYDARVGGGFPEAEEPIPCEGNACQGLLSAPVDPGLNTTLPGLGNPKVRYLGEAKHCKRGQVKRKGKCVKKGKKKRGKRSGHGKRGMGGNRGGGR